MDKMNRHNDNYNPFSSHAIKMPVTVKKFQINQAISTKNINTVVYYNET